MPTTMQLIDQADSNSDLDERTTEHLFLELLPAGTPSLKLSFQLPVDALHAKVSTAVFQVLAMQSIMRYTNMYVRSCSTVDFQ